MNSINLKNKKGFFKGFIKNLIFGKGIDIYFPGCLTEKLIPELKENYLKIADLLNLKLETLELVCCGMPVKNAGNSIDLLKKEWNNLIEDYQIKNIYTSCPSCYVQLKHETLKSVQDRVEVKPLLQLFYETLKQNHISIKRLNLKITYHDPCHFSRHEDFIKVPRELLKMIGCQIIEMKHSKQNSMCCGAGGGVINNNPNLANQVAKKRIEEALETNASLLVTSCPLCYLHLKKNANKNLKVIEISELILKSINN